VAARRDYRRLRGAGWGLLGRSSLWLGRDHLLAAETYGFTEVYRRFYFHDLQAIVIQQSRARRDWNLIVGLVAGLVAGLFGLILLVSGMDATGWTILAILESPLLLGLLANNLRGPTCRVQIRTAVQTAELPSLRRLRNAERMLDTVRPLIAQAQGVITADMLRTLNPAAAANPAPSSPGESGVASPAEKQTDTENRPEIDLHLL
jgi:hypothetical protein